MRDRCQAQGAILREIQVNHRRYGLVCHGRSYNARWRPADRGGDASTDIVFDLAAVTYDEFLDRLADLREEVAGVPHLLARFRDGDESLIAIDRLTGSGTDPLAEKIARQAFYDGLEETTQRLQAAAIAALIAIRAEREALANEVEEFATRFHGYSFHPYPASIDGKPRGREEAIAHGREAHSLNRRLAGNPALARLNSARCRGSPSAPGSTR